MFTKKDKKKLAEIINRNFSRHGNYIDFTSFFHDLTEWLAKDNPHFIWKNSPLNVPETWKNKQLTSRPIVS